jgi:hypothetical protein
MTRIRDCETILLLMPRLTGHKLSSVQPRKPHISLIKCTNHPRQADEQTVIRILESPMQSLSYFIGMQTLPVF